MSILVSKDGTTTVPRKIYASHENVAKLVYDSDWEKIVTPGDYGAIYYLVETGGGYVLRGRALDTLNDFNSVCEGGNSINIGSLSIPKVDIVAFKWGTAPLSIGTFFLYNCPNLIYMDNPPSGIESIGGYFMSNCSSFTRNLLFPSTLKTIGSSFMYGCSFLYSCPDLSNTMVTKIPNSFLSGCKRLYKLNGRLPNATTEIGDSFLSGCGTIESFALPNSITKIGNGFMESCYQFNNSVTMPTDLKTIGDNFMRDCVKFSHNMTISASLDSIGDYFMFGCRSFSKKLDIKAVKTIGDYFLSNSGTSIGNVFGIGVSINFTNNGQISNNFLNHTNIDSLALSGDLRSIGNYFMYYSTCSTVTIPSSCTTIGNSFGAHSIFSSFSFETGSVLQSIGNYFFYFARVASNIKLPTSCTVIGEGFLSYATFHNTYPVISLTGVKNIPQNFMTQVKDISISSISFGSNVTINCTGFLNGALNFCGPITIGSSPTLNNTTSSTLATTNSAYLCYRVGIQITGNGASAFKAALPNSSSRPYRKLF